VEWSCAAVIVFFEFRDQWAADEWLGFGPAWLRHLFAFAGTTFVVCLFAKMLAAGAWFWVNSHVLGRRGSELAAPAYEAYSHAASAAVLTALALLAVLHRAVYP